MNNLSLKSRYRHRNQQGATLVELIYVLPLFFILLFGIIEVSYVYRAKATLNVATFDAARTGSMNNASVSDMRRALASAMVPEFVKGNKSAAGLIQAYARARAFEVALNAAAVGGLDTINIISPNRAMFDAFKQRVPILDVGRQRVSFVEAIPNDNLTYRPTRTRRLRIGGNNEDINIQDANILKIKSLWCHELMVPGLRELAYRSFLGNVLFNTPEQRICNLLGNAPGFRGVYVAITAQSVVRMQSPIFRGGLR